MYQVSELVSDESITNIAIWLQNYNQLNQLK